ncbi:portal protein [Brevundimonas pondensis]|uniref:Portal protein n=1 Tax=Brevundimonas pondensis TaxID=2774189 RepID=A0ABX7SLS9_9CAUL|nr:hypothetical protein [Brevundimonas pondensis]QTC88101.1 hypothetical protein IFE19_01450 [Brevundimonas pondensis]
MTDRMDDSQLQSIVAAEIADAVSFIDDDIGPQRVRAVDYYFGRPFGDEEPGRSQIVSRDVHDMISAAMPSLMRIFFGPENVVEFEPYGPEDVDEAEQKTDYVNYIVTTDNDGFEIFYAVLKNALREKVGITKTWWDNSEEVCTRSYTGLDEDGLTLLLEDLNKARKAELVESSEDEAGLSVRIKLTRPVDKVCIEAIPPEEFLISRDARSLDEAAFKAHRTTKTVSDLIALGYDREDIEAGASDDLDWNEERQARNPALNGLDDAIDPTMRQVLYVEAYVRADYDGDGIAELMKVCTVGPGYKVIHKEPADDHPFADFHVDPEPHTFFGESLADKTMDVQESKSRLLRAGFDGLAQSLFPRTVVGRNGNMEDALNTEVGAVLRADGDASSAYFFQAAPNTAQHAFPFLTYMDELRENRTGMSKVSMGLDAEALQNTTATAAEGNFTRSQERIELMARILASGMRKLFRRVAVLVTENQRAERMVKLRNKWVPMDPRAWRSDMNVICNVGLGGGSPEQKISVLSMIAGKQEAIMLQTGPDNPLVTVKQYHTTLSKLVQEAGFKNPDAFFTDPESDEVKQRMAAKAQEPPPPDPKVVEAEQRLQLEAQKAEAQMQFQVQKAAADLQIAREKMAMDIEAQREKQRLEAEFRREQAVAELQLKRDEMAMEFELKRQANELNAQAKVAAASTTVNGPEQGGEPG